MADALYQLAKLFQITVKFKYDFIYKKNNNSKSMLSPEACMHRTPAWCPPLQDVTLPGSECVQSRIRDSEPLQ